MGEQTKGFDLTAPTPDLPRQEPEQLPEDATFLGFSANTGAERAQIKLARRKQDIQALKDRFALSDQVIKKAQTYPEGEKRTKFLNNVSPSLERVFPGSSQQIRTFSEDKEGYQKVMKTLSNPRQKAIFEAHLQSGDTDAAMTFVEGLYNKTRGSSEFERLNAKRESEGLNPLEEKRVGVLAGSEMREGPRQSLSHRRKKQNEEFTLKLRKEAKSGTEHFSSMQTNISKALALMDSGDNQLSDSLLATVTSQITDPDIRAMAMFTQFDKSYGNVAERTLGGIKRFVSGARTDSDKAIIKETLENFRDAHVKPGVNKLKTEYRNLAIEQGYDPFEVVPPKSPEDIRDHQGISRDEKIRLLKRYYPEKFK